LVVQLLVKQLAMLVVIQDALLHAKVVMLIVTALVQVIVKVVPHVSVVLIVPHVMLV
jgi:hypothetical protein